jgi:hypothetical protein
MPFFKDKEVVACLEEPRISEQQIGNFQSVQHVVGKCDSMKYISSVNVRGDSDAIIRTGINNSNINIRVMFWYDSRQGREVKIRTFLLQISQWRSRS